MQTVKKKIPVMQIVRHIAQVAAFFIYPGLFANSFFAIKSLYISVLEGSFTWASQLSSIFLIGSLLIVTVLLGRIFCGFLCSFGALGDLIWWISSHTLRPKFRISGKADAILKYAKFVLLGVIVLFGWTLSLWNFDGYNSPWTAFALLVTPSAWNIGSFFLTIGFALLLVICFGSFFIERFFCRYFCPLGAILTVVSKPRIFRIRKTRKNCGACALCTAKCSMGIPLGTVDIVRSGECIGCFKCTDVCPRKNATADPQPLVTATLAIAAASGLIYVGNVFDNLQTSASVVYGSTSSETTDSASSAASGSASSGTSDSSSSAVSGSASSGTTDSSSSAASSSQTSGKYTDGVYTGSGAGLRGTTSVSVTVENGEITSIEVTSYQDDSQYFTRAKNTIITEILSAQDINVTTVSGATFSSNGIIEAVADALNVDFTNPNSSMTGGGHGGH